MQDLRIFDLTTAQSLLESSEKFPVDFDIAWQWLGYSRKDNALKTLKKHFDLNIDYAILGVFRHEAENSIGRPSDDYFLTVDCFKHLAMMAGTPKGKQVRQYFLECERIAKAVYQETINQTRAIKMANDAVCRLKEVEKLHPVTFQQAVIALGLDAGNQLEALNTSLIANRLGLAFNKQIKAFEKLSESMSPEAFDSLKEAYYKLAEDHAQLLKTKTPQPVVEYVERVVTQQVIVKDEVAIAKLENIINKQRSEIDELREKLLDKQWEINNMLNSTKRLPSI